MAGYKKVSVPIKEIPNVSTLEEARGATPTQSKRELYDAGMVETASRQGLNTGEISEENMLPIEIENNGYSVMRKKGQLPT